MDVCRIKVCKNRKKPALCFWSNCFNCLWRKSQELAVKEVSVIFLRVVLMCLTDHQITAEAHSYPSASCESMLGSECVCLRTVDVQLVFLWIPHGIPSKHMRTTVCLSDTQRRQVCACSKVRRLKQRTSERQSLGLILVLWCLGVRHTIGCHLSQPHLHNLPDLGGVMWWGWGGFF